MTWHNKPSPADDELNRDQKLCTMIWESYPGNGPILSELPLILQLKRDDRLIIVELIINPQQFGNKIYGIGIR